MSGSRTPTARPRVATVTAAARLAPVGGAASVPSRPVATPGEAGRFDRRIVAVVTVLVAISLAGLPYYLAPAAERLRSPMHAWFKPSGYVGQSAGILAFALFAFMWLYPLRKRFPRLLGITGSMARWLDVHILAGIALPLLGAIHAGWRFQGLIGLGYLSMVLVSISGIVGKYLYTRIPRNRAGLELTVEEVEARRRDLAERIARTTALDLAEVEATLTVPGEDVRSAGLAALFHELVASDLVRWRLGRSVRRRLKQGARAGGVRLDRATLRQATALVRQRLRLTHQLRRLDATHRLFRFWHVAHRPFAVTALLAVTIHVAVVVALGVTWLY